MKNKNFNQLPRFYKSMQLTLEGCNIQNLAVILIILEIFIVAPDLLAGPAEDQLPSKARQLKLNQQILNFELGNNTHLELRRVPTGRFLFSGPEDESGQIDEGRSPREVVVNDQFWIGKHEVTRRQMLVVFGRYDPLIHNQESDLNRPISFVSWVEAKIFCTILTEQERATGRLKKDYEFRLPTEIEWEYACHAGKSKTFGIGDGQNLNSNLANFDGAYPHGESVQGPTIGRTVIVGAYEGNEWGIHDMHGNVWEWCLDSFIDNSLIEQTANFSGLKITTVIRGGGWTSSGRFCQASSRIICLPTLKRPNLGFRVVIGHAYRNNYLPPNRNTVK